MLWNLNSSMHKKEVWRASCKQGSPKSRDQHTESKDSRDLWNTMFHWSQMWIIQVWSKWGWWLLVWHEWFRWCLRSRRLEGTARLPSPRNKGIMGRECSEKYNMKIEKFLFDRDEFLDFWTTKCWLKTSQSSEKPLDSNGNWMYWLTFWFDIKKTSLTLHFVVACFKL